MTLTVANILTLSRLLLAPVFVYFFVRDEKFLALVCFCVAGFTDLIDGSVARLLRQPSKWGAALDPIADKVLMESCFLVLLWKDVLPLWFFALALLRDIMIVVGLLILRKKKLVQGIKPIWSSKVATLFQLAVAVASLAVWYQPDGVLAGVTYLQAQSFFLIVAASLIVVSAIQYIFIGRERLRLGAKAS